MQYTLHSFFFVFNFFLFKYKKVIYDKRKYRLMHEQNEKGKIKKVDRPVESFLIRGRKNHYKIGQNQKHF